MPLATYALLGKITVGSSNAANIEFANIPQSYADLVLKGSARSTITNSNYGYWDFTINSSTSNLSFRRIIGYNGGPGSNHASQNQLFVGSNTGFTGWGSDLFSNVELYVASYTSSNYKAISYDGVIENDSSTSEKAFQELSIVQWADSSAISSIKITPGSGNFAQYSTFYLYGIKNS